MSISSGSGTHVAGKVRAATIAVVNEAGGGVVESSVEIVAGTLSVELAGAVGNVGLSSGQAEVKSLEELEHLVRIHTQVPRNRALFNQTSGPRLQQSL